MQVKERFSSLIGAHIQGKLGIFKDIPLAPAKTLLCSTENTSFEDE
jgi:hypothetical protein